jgi:hypothetical protein
VTGPASIRIGLSVCLGIFTVSSLAAQSGRWSFAENPQEGAKFGLTSGMHYKGLLLTCKAPAREVEIEADLDKSVLRVISAMLSQGEGFYIDIVAGKERESVILPDLSQKEFGANWVLKAKISLNSNLFHEIARTGQLRILGDSRRTPNAKALNFSFAAEEGKEDILMFVDRCQSP